MQNIEEKS
jgi:hypothetical protein